MMDMIAKSKFCLKNFYILIALEDLMVFPI